MIDDKQKKMIEEYAQMVATNLILYGVDMRNKYDSAVSMSVALENAYLRGRSDGLKYAYERAKKVGEWIPVSERLPKERDSIFKKVKGTDKWSNAMFEGISDDVNVTVEYEDGTRKTMTSHTLDGIWKCEKDMGIKRKVIAWQPLPEPYKE